MASIVPDWTAAFISEMMPSISGPAHTSSTPSARASSPSRVIGPSGTVYSSGTANSTVETPGVASHESMARISSSLRPPASDPQCPSASLLSVAPSLPPTSSAAPAPCDGHAVAAIPCSGFLRLQPAPLRLAEPCPRPAWPASSTTPTTDRLGGATTSGALAVQSADPRREPAASPPWWESTVAALCRPLVPGSVATPAPIALPTTMPFAAPASSSPVAIGSASPSGPAAANQASVVQ